MSEFPDADTRGGIAADPDDRSRNILYFAITTCLLFLLRVYAVRVWARVPTADAAARYAKAAAALLNEHSN